VVSLCRLKLCFNLHKDTTPPQQNHNVTPTHIEPEQYNIRNKSTKSRKLLKMDVLTYETCSALNSEIIKQVTSSWSNFIQLSRSRFPSLCELTSNKKKIRRGYQQTRQVTHKRGRKISSTCGALLLPFEWQRTRVRNFGASGGAVSLPRREAQNDLAWPVRCSRIRVIQYSCYRMYSVLRESQRANNSLNSIQ